MITFKIMYTLFIKYLNEWPYRLEYENEMLLQNWAYVVFWVFTWNDIVFRPWVWLVCLIILHLIYCQYSNMNLPSESTVPWTVPSKSCSTRLLLSFPSCPFCRDPSICIGIRRTTWFCPFSYLRWTKGESEILVQRTF